MIFCSFLALRNLGIQCKCLTSIHLDDISKRRLTYSAKTVDVSKLRYFIQGSLVTVVMALSGSDGKGILVSPTLVSYWFACEKELSFDTIEDKRSFQRQSSMVLRVYKFNI